MLIATGPLTPLFDLIETLCWIILPVLALTFLVTVLHHYVQKKKNAANALAEEELALLTLPANNAEGAYLFFDHSGLIKDYKKKLSYSNARYSALRKDFELLEERYKKERGNGLSIHLKTSQMENEQIQFREGQVMSEELYLKDIIEEKKAQVDFLQAQLEQRIRRLHELEGEKERTRAEFETRLLESEELIRSKEEYLVFADNQLAELKQQNELLNAAVADGADRERILEEQLLKQESKLFTIEQQLAAKKQLIQRLYKEFAAALEEEVPASPVVTLRPDYTGSDWQETAAR